MIRRPPRSTLSSSSAASDVYKRQLKGLCMRRKKAWQVYPEQPELVTALMARHNLPRLVARILLNRGLAAADDILAFLDPSLERLNPPFELPDLEVAAARLGRAVRQGEPVA